MGIGIVRVGKAKRAAAVFKANLKRKSRDDLSFGDIPRSGFCVARL